MEFTDAMDQPVGFKIPVRDSANVSMWPDTFTLARSEYGSCIDAFLDHRIVGGGGEVGVVSRDASWLNLFQDLGECIIVRDDVDPSSSRQAARSDAVITKSTVLVGKCEVKAAESGMDIAATELRQNMADDAYRTFPRGLTSIPAWTSSSNKIHLHQLAYCSTTKSYSTKFVRGYRVSDANQRHEVVLDLFKILKWMAPIQEPNMHLFPDLQYHVERGYCNSKSVTITSIGQTLQSAEFKDRQVIVDQVRAALDELHGIGVAHCDVRMANVFVLLDGKRVILGDLEYCRPVDDTPPNVTCFPKDKPCATARELDEYQFQVFVDEVAKM